MIECQRLWTCDTNDPQVGTMVIDDKKEEVYLNYLNLKGWQYLQIFRTKILTNLDEIKSGEWLAKASDELIRHFACINAHLNLSRGKIIQGTEDQVVGEGSGPKDRGMRPIRVMHGLVSFEACEGFNPDWTPGLLFLKGRLLKLMEPYPTWDAIEGRDAEYMRESCWLSEVALGFLEDGSQRWEPRTIFSAAKDWLEEAKKWK